ncbi:hypothetical protein KGV52_01720, partial [Candidatus Gracilibacteria bacterium]|nr:hypothetical protein [Candidatus Gracilibacteria bacterium]
MTTFEELAQKAQKLPKNNPEQQSSSRQEVDKKIDDVKQTIETQEEYKAEELDKLISTLKSQAVFRGLGVKLENINESFTDKGGKMDEKTQDILKEMINTYYAESSSSSKREISNMLRGYIDKLEGILNPPRNPMDDIDVSDLSGQSVAVILSKANDITLASNFFFEPNIDTQDVARHLESEGYSPDEIGEFLETNEGFNDIVMNSWAPFVKDMDERIGEKIEKIQSAKKGEEFSISFKDITGNPAHTFTDRKEAAIFAYKLKKTFNDMQPWTIGEMKRGVTEHPVIATTIASGVGVIGVTGFVMGAFISYINNNIDKVNNGLSQDRLNTLQKNVDDVISKFTNQGVNVPKKLGDLSGELRQIDSPQSSGQQSKALFDTYKDLKQYTKFGQPSRILANIKSGLIEGKIDENGGRTNINKMGLFKFVKNWGVLKSFILANVNSGPDGIAFKNMNAVVDDYSKRFEVINNILDYTFKLVDDSSSIADADKGGVKEDILKIFTKDSIFGGKLNTKIQKQQLSDLLYRKRIITTPIQKKNLLARLFSKKSAYETTFDRFIRGEVLPNIKNDFEKVSKVIEFHPVLSSNEKQRLLNELNFEKHAGNHGTWRSKFMSKIRGSSLSYGGNYEDFKELIPELDMLTKANLTGMRNNLQISDQGLKNQVSIYLNGISSPGEHKAVVYSNIMKILSRQSPDTTFSTLADANQFLSSHSLDGLPHDGIDWDYQVNRAPNNAAPNNATPNNAAPNNAAPNNAAPNNAAPNNAAPNNAAPNNAAPN